MTTASLPSYVIVTPARDEADYLPDLIGSMLSQTVPFSRWVIVDDGSTDATLEIARRLESSDPRVSVLERGDRERRVAGCGDMEAYMAGLASLESTDDYDFIGKLDADLVMPADYFERLFAEFAADEKLGIAGGHCYNRVGDKLVLDRVPDTHVRGATKTYRQVCFRDLSPLDQVPGWDTVDEVKARGLGWKTRSFAEHGVIHQKPVTGGSGSVVRGRFVLGQMSHYLGYRPAYLALRVVRNAAKPPYLLGAAAMAAGYATAALSGRPRIDDPAFRDLLRAYQKERVAAMIRPGRSQSKGLELD